MTTLRTRITDLLDHQNIPYRVLPHSEPVYTVETAAQQRGAPVEEMVKSILLRDKKKRYVMACVLGNARLDPKAVRAHLPEGWWRLSFASGTEVLAVTGCVQGAVAPVGLPEEVPVIFDEPIANLNQVNISSGDPMAGLELDSSDLIRISGAQLAPISEPRSSD
jgi:prolyl-tRNA editing enzyme YbaK/EbsC (Cys-tRNA(Pro) deacylase)